MAYRKVFILSIFFFLISCSNKSTTQKKQDNKVEIFKNYGTNSIQFVDIDSVFGGRLNFILEDTNFFFDNNNNKPSYIGIKVVIPDSLLKYTTGFTQLK